MHIPDLRIIIMHLIFCATRFCSPLTLIGHPYSSARMLIWLCHVRGWIRTKRAWNGGKVWWLTMESRSKLPRKTYKEEKEKKKEQKQKHLPSFSLSRGSRGMVAFPPKHDLKVSNCLPKVSNGHYLPSFSHAPCTEPSKSRWGCRTASNWLPTEKNPAFPVLLL